jgi:hypothetical protein
LQLHSSGALRQLTGKQFEKGDVLLMQQLIALRERKEWVILVRLAVGLTRYSRFQAKMYHHISRCDIVSFAQPLCITTAHHMWPCSPTGLKAAHVVKKNLYVNHEGLFTSHVCTVNMGTQRIACI